MNITREMNTDFMAKLMEAENKYMADLKEKGLDAESVCSIDNPECENCGS